MGGRQSWDPDPVLGPPGWPTWRIGAAPPTQLLTAHLASAESEGVPDLGIVPWVAEQKVLLDALGAQPVGWVGRSGGTGCCPIGLPCTVAQAVHSPRNHMEEARLGAPC